jgi:hypothetical protein
MERLGEFRIGKLKILQTKLTEDYTEKKRLLTHATTDLGNWLNGKLVLYLG